MVYGATKAEALAKVKALALHVLADQVEHGEAKEVEPIKLAAQAWEFVEIEAADEDDGSLEKVIGLVDEWMKDESGYDEKTYPAIEAGLRQNRLSL